MNRRLLLAPAALLCAVASVSPATAEPSLPRTARVPYADLNLASPSGRTMLERRVTSAADGLCGQNGYVDLARHRAILACRTDAISQAMAQVLTAGAGHAEYAAIEVGAEQR